MNSHRNPLIITLALTVVLLTAAVVEASGYYCEFVSRSQGQHQMMAKMGQAMQTLEQMGGMFKPDGR